MIIHTKDGIVMASVNEDSDGKGLNVSYEVYKYASTGNFHVEGKKHITTDDIQAHHKKETESEIPFLFPEVVYERVLQFPKK